MRENTRFNTRFFYLEVYHKSNCIKHLMPGRKYRSLSTLSTNDPVSFLLIHQKYIAYKNYFIKQILYLF